MSEFMKQSGIDWIGNIPESWEIKKLGLICKQIGDIDHYMPESVDEGIPYVMTGDFIGNQNEIDFENCKKISYKDFLTLSKKIKPEKGDILFARYATVGTVRYVESDIDFLVSYACLIVKPLLGNVNGKFLYHYFFSNSFNEEVSKYINTNTQANVGSDSLNRIKITVPPLNEQTLISDFLDKKCEKIDSITSNLEKQIEILQKYKKSLVTETVTKGLDKSVSMKGSGIEWIGDIPEHWEVKRLKFILENSAENMKVGPFGSALTSGDYTDEGMWVYNQRTVLDNNFMENDTFISEDKYKELQGFKVNAGDILITTRGTIGKIAIVPENAERGILHPCIIKFRTNKDLIKPELVKLIFNESDFAKDQFAIMSNATTIDVIYSYSLKDIVLPVIPPKEQDDIYSYLNNKCSKIDAIIESKKEQLTKITQHKKSLIYEYVTGKKRVKGAYGNDN